ncbi:hypothetical protein [Ideonella sp. YS5]|uniref:hypothetical protein n=1 Tax=Ideonella sp. YS5 TaxID=3453714 RepID=UPI003EE9CBF6
MLKHRLSSTAAIAAALAALGGCATHVRFESSPPGARVDYEQRKLVLGTTPFDATITDDFGWFSIYSFTATLPGYEPAVVEFRERTPLDAQNIVPAVVRFELKPRGPALAASGTSR